MDDEIRLRLEKLEDNFCEPVLEKDRFICKCGETAGLLGKDFKTIIYIDSKNYCAYCGRKLLWKKEK
jgi:DNA-directed RNA polymerase subunit RPC12/RpoP